MSPELATQLVSAQFPKLVEDPTVSLVGEGWDNWVYAVGRWLFRFPRRRVAIPLIQREIAVLPHLATRVPLPIPNPLWVGKPSDAYPYPFFGYAPVPGSPVASQSLSLTDRVRSAAPLASFLKGLHQLSPEFGEASGAGPPTLGRLDLGVRLPRLYRWLEDAKRLGLVSDETPFLCEARRIEGCGATLDEVCVVHGDLNFKNVLIDGTGVLSGVIDWGDCHVGLPATDFLFPIGFLPASGQKIFRDAYGPIDQQAWQMGRFLAMFVNLIVLVSAHSFGHTQDMQEARWELGNILSIDPVTL